jgi:folate-binding protein YgfZ
MYALSSLAIVNITGIDAKSFLQGQLSNDLNLLTNSHALLASCNSAQGRVQAVLTLVERDDGIAAVLPRSMVDLLVTRLRKYILRSKVAITSAVESLQCFSASREDLLAADLAVPALSGEHTQCSLISVMRWWDRDAERYLVLQSPTDLPVGDELWTRADIRAGLPQVFPATHEAFVAQMINLDAVNGISFNKGCYTGQEIIARAHFRGTVKRRMYRLSASCEPPAPATRVLVQRDGAHAGDVVMAASNDQGSELLAVLNINQQNSVLCLETHRTVPLTFLQLPYQMPP